MKKLTVLTLLLVLVGALHAECEFMGMISKAGKSATWVNPVTGGGYINPNDPLDFMSFISTHSATNDDGWGIVAYDGNGYLPQMQFPYIAGTQFPYGHQYYPPGGYSNSPISIGDINQGMWWGVQREAQYDPVFYNNCEDGLFVNNTRATERSVILGHVRNGTGGLGAHPFIHQANGKTYTFMHNGRFDSPKQTIFNHVENDCPAGNLVVPASMGGNPSQWAYSGMSNINDWIDSEIFFKYIVDRIEEENGNVLRGLHKAMNGNATIRNAIMSPPAGNIGDHKLNIVFSDGEHVYAFVNYRSNEPQGYDSEYEICYKDFGNYYGLVSERSYAMNPADGWQSIEQFQLVVFSRNGITKFDDFVTPTGSDYVFLPDASGAVGELTYTALDAIPQGGKGYISADCYMGSSYGLYRQDLEFAGTYELDLTGHILMVDRDADIDLNHGSIIKAHQGSEFFLRASANLYGNVPLSYQYYFNTTHNRMYRTSTKIPGDRVSVMYTGRFHSVGVSPTNPTKIGTRARNGKWDGIYFDQIYAGTNQPVPTMRFRYARFYNLENLKVYPEGVDPATYIPPGPFEYHSRMILHLDTSTVSNVDNFIIRDYNTGLLAGESSTNRTNINSSKYIGVSAEKSKLVFQNATVEKNGAGVFILESAEQYSRFEDTVITSNPKFNVYLVNALVGELKYTAISDSQNGFGILCEEGTRFVDMGYAYDAKIYDNYDYQFSAQQTNSFHMDETTRYYIECNIPNHTPKLLRNYEWAWFDPAVNIRGTTVLDAERIYNYPNYDEAWRSIDERSASQYQNYFSAGNFERAKAQALEIIASNPSNPLANESLYDLYHIAIADDSVNEFEEYLTKLDDESLEVTAKLLLAKLDMLNNNYLSVVNKTEQILALNCTNAERLNVLASQGYAYLMLTDAQKQYTSCTFAPESLNEYQEKLGEYRAGKIEELNNPISGNTPEFKALTASNYPNPFNPVTKIDYTVPADGKVLIDIYNVKGQKVKTLVNGFKMAGKHNIEWQGKDANNQSVASGVYFYKIKTTNKTLTKKMLLLK